MPFCFIANSVSARSAPTSWVLRRQGEHSEGERCEEATALTESVFLRSTCHHSYPQYAPLNYMGNDEPGN